jgi:hypothetical protein
MALRTLIANYNTVTPKAPPPTQVQEVPMTVITGPLGTPGAELSTGLKAAEVPTHIINGTIVVRL